MERVVLTGSRPCSRRPATLLARSPASHQARIAATARLRRSRERARLRELLQAARCADCGTHDFAVLQFDDRVPLCANCHRRRVGRQFGWRALLGRRHDSLRVLTRLRRYACAACGEADPVVLDLEHLLDPARPRCANCHRREAVWLRPWIAKTC